MSLATFITSPSVETEGEAVNLPISLPLGQESDEIHKIQITGLVFKRRRTGELKVLLIAHQLSPYSELISLA